MILRVIVLISTMFLGIQVSSWGQSNSNVSDRHLLRSDEVSTEIQKVVDKVAEFPGNHLSYFSENFKYPLEAQENEVEGKIVVTFVVEIDGSITGINFENKLGFGIEEEVIKVFKRMSKWKPAQVNGKPVRSQFKMPIKLALE